MKYLNEIKKEKSFIEFGEPIKFNGFNAIGYFPYKTKKIRGLKVPRKVFEEIDHQTCKDNKVVVVFEDTTNFGTHNFAIFFHDLGAISGIFDELLI